MLPRLCRASFLVKLAVTGFVLIIGGGYLASLAHLQFHFENKDEREGLGMEDLVGSYSGLDQPSPLLVAIEGEHGAPYIENEDEREILVAWLRGTTIAESYDALVPGSDLSPADVLDMSCVDCHERNPDTSRVESGEVSDLALDNWPDVQKVAFSRQLAQVPVDVLVTSTHTHALSLPLVALAVGALFLLCRGPRVLRHGIVALCSLGLLADLGCMWLARIDPLWVRGIVAGGAVFGATLGLMLLWIFVDLWLPGGGGASNDENGGSGP